MRTISVRLDDTTDVRLRQLCDQTRQSQTEIIKAAIALLANQEVRSPAQSAAEWGLIGGFDSGVGDLGRDHARHVRTTLASKRQRDGHPAAD